MVNIRDFEINATGLKSARTICLSMIELCGRYN